MLPLYIRTIPPGIFPAGFLRLLLQPRGLHGWKNHGILSMGKTERTREETTMRKIRCAACGKTYDYDDDAFCPKCGAFNQPSRGQRTMQVTRKDGLSEAGHDHSFLHEEYHAEERQRRASDLNQKVLQARETIRRQAAQPSRSSTRNGKTKIDGKKIVKWIVIAYFAMAILSSLMRACMYAIF